MSSEAATADVPPASPSPSLAWPPWAISVSVAIVYFLAARLSLALIDKADGVAVFRPAAGLATGILLAFGSTVRWPVVIGVIVATFAANLLGDRNLASTTFFAVANAGGPIIVAGLIHRSCRAPFDLNELRCVFALFGATIITAIISGTWARLDLCSFIPRSHRPRRYGVTGSLPRRWAALRSRR